MNEKRVYTFGNGKAEGNAQMREVLGGKGANLAEMNLIGVPVPPGFTITTDTCNEYYEVGEEKIKELLQDEVKAAVAHTADAEIQRCHRSGGGAVHMVSLLSADAASPAAVGVYRPVHGKVRGLPPEPKIQYTVDRPCGTVSTGDHQ